MEVLVRPFPPLLVSFALLAFAPPLMAQAEVWRTFGDVRVDRLGHSVATVPDADGDGQRDLLVGAPAGEVSISNNTNFSLVGRAQIRSGATGALLGEWIGSHAGAHFGARVAALGDVD